MAERDPVLFRKLDMAAAAAHESGKALEARLKKALDAATRTHDFISWREAAGWAAGVGDALDAIGGLASDSRASRSYPADLLILVLVEENLFDVAWNAVRLHDASMGVKETLARTEFTRDARDVYESRVAGLVESGANSA